MRHYVIVTESHHLWLVWAASLEAAEANWNYHAESGEYEELLFVRLPKSRAEIDYLRDIGQSDY